MVWVRLTKPSSKNFGKPCLITKDNNMILRKLAFCALECRSSALSGAIFAAIFEIIVPSCQEITND